MLSERGDWMLLGNADEQKPANLGALRVPRLGRLTGNRYAAIS